MKGLRLLAIAIAVAATLGWSGTLSSARQLELEPEDASPIQCGVAVTSVLSRDTVDAYAFEGSTGDAVALQAIDVSGTLGLLRMRLIDPEEHMLAETCSDRIQQVLPRHGSYRLEVSDCVPEDASTAGNYTLTLNAISTTLAGEPNCGIPVACDPGIYTGSLQDPAQQSLFGAVAGYRFMLTTPGTVSIGALDPSGHGVLELRLYDPNGALVAGNCSGGIDAHVGVGVYTILVNDCSGAAVHNYSLSFRVVSQGPDNCALPLQCGATPVVVNLGVPGEVDAYKFSGAAGDRVTIITTDVTGTIQALRLRIFDPDGMAVAGTTSCVSAVRGLRLPKGGTYTALVSACDLPTTGLYSISYQAPSCPAGPDITFLGLARADSSPVSPAGFDEAGRPVYPLTGGSGFFVVIEARPGSSHASVASQGFNYNPDDARVLPDLQAILSQPLGNGSRAVCDDIPPDAGGVPATLPLVFPEELPEGERSAVANAINDFGCRVNDGTGEPLGVNAAGACTTFSDGESHFVDPSSTLQFCTPIDTAWSFRHGKTIVRARVRDVQGAVGAAREMAVLVAGDYCHGDCDGNKLVTIDELLEAVNVVLGGTPVGECTAVDVNGDGQVTVDEVLAAVNSSLGGCPEAQS